MNERNVKSFITEALECSVVLNPRSPGLTFVELKQIGARLGFGEGEISDAFVTSGVHTLGGGSKLLGPDQQTRNLWKVFLPQTPEYRNFEAFDLIYSEFTELARNLGKARAQIGRDTLVARAVARGIPEIDIEAAITMLVFSTHMVEKDKILRFEVPVYERGRLPSEQVKFHHGARQRDSLSALFPMVRDVISRRTDGRSVHAEPLDAFAEKLASLGYAAFRMWWVQMVDELRRSDVHSSSVSVCVLAAALIEGGLTFVVGHARAKRIGPFGSSTFDKDPRTWRIDDLVSSAASGGPSAILSPATRSRADGLIQSRQRIHAGRMLSEHPGGVPDLRPDEARDAKRTAELVVRSLLDWLEKFPPETP